MTVLFFRDEITLAVLSLTEDGTLQMMKKSWWDKGECGYDTGYRVGGKYFSIITTLLNMYTLAD